MPAYKDLVANPRAGRVVFFASILVLIFWGMSWYIVDNVYKRPIVGAFFEMLWLPMLALLVVLPLIALIQLIQVKFSSRGFPLYSFVINILLIILFLIQLSNATIS